MFSRAAAKTLTTVAGRRTAIAARNSSKLSSPARAMSDVAASTPKQPIDIPPPAGKHWRGHGHRHCHGRGKRVAGKALAFGLVGYGGYWYGSKYGAAAEPPKINPSSVVGEQSIPADAGSSQK